MILGRGQQLNKQLRGKVVAVQIKLSLGNLIVVMVVSAFLLCLIDVQDHLKDLRSEVLRLDGIRGQSKCVANHA